MPIILPKQKEEESRGCVEGSPLTLCQFLFEEEVLLFDRPMSTLEHNNNRRKSFASVTNENKIK